MNEALSVESVPLTSEYVNLSPTSGSVEESGLTTVPAGWFSAMVLDQNMMLAGGSFTFVTEIVKDFSVKSPPASAERTRIE